MFDLSKKAVGVDIEVRKAPSGMGVVGHEEGAMPPPQNSPSPENFLFFFRFKMVHSGTFSYTNNSKVLFPINLRERYVITVFLAIDGADIGMRSQVFINLVNLSPSSQSVATRVCSQLQ